MASYTPNLDLLKKSPVTDGDDMFNVETMLNENWDRIDRGVGDYTTPAQKMGLTGDLSVGASLGVLADIGNVHVWRKTVTTEEEVPAKYELGPVQTNVEIIRSGATHPAALKPTAHYTATINVDDGGNLSLESPRDYSAQSNGVQWGHLWADGATVLVNKFVTFSSDEYQSSQVLDGFWFIPSDATFSTENTDEYTITQVSKIQRVTGRALIPPGTHITYLTSTNRNAYQEGDNEYLGVLGDKVTIVEGSYTLSRGETKKINLGFRPQIVMLYRNGTNTETASDLVLTSSRYVAFDNYNQYSVDFTMLSNGFSTQWEQSREDDPYTIDYKAISGGLIE